LRIDTMGALAIAGAGALAYHVYNKLRSIENAVADMNAEADAGQTVSIEELMNMAQAHQGESVHVGGSFPVAGQHDDGPEDKAFKPGFGLPA
jgi:hypothetical protein